MKKQTKLWIALAVAATIFFLIFFIIVAKVMFGPSDEKTEEIECDYASFATIADLQVIKDDADYSASGTVTIPDMSMYITKFSENISDDVTFEWNVMEEKLLNAFHKAIKSQKELVMVTYKVEVDLTVCAKEYQMTREYFEKYGDISTETFEFTEEQIREYLIREAYQKNLEVLLMK